METPFFSSRWYRLAYPDAAAHNPSHHYLLTGWKEGRAIRKTLDRPLRFAVLKDRISSLATVSKPIV